MTYLKTVNLWEGDTTERLLNGSLTLKAGQWVQCGNGPKSRFVGVTLNTVWVAHYNGEKYGINKRFSQMLKSLKKRVDVKKVNS